MHEVDSKIGEVWDQKQREQKAAQSWWQFKQVYSHIGRKIEGSFIAYIRAQTGNRKFKQGISVGCGNGIKEMRLLQGGVVEHFDLYELSQQRIEDGRQRAIVTGTGKLIHVGTEELIHLNEGIMAALSGDGLVRGIHADQDIAQAGQEPSRHCL